METNKDFITVHNNNVPLISVTVGSNENTEIWNNCISSEFPIMNMDINKDKAICQIGSPHQGYTLIAKQKNGKLDEKAILHDYDNRIVANFTYQEGVANGRCKMYYRSGEIYFSGFLLEGYRNGSGVEYRKDGGKIYEGFYKNGRKARNIKKRSDNSHYWNEKDQYGRMVSMFQIDDIGLYHGICYIYNNGKLSKISRWEHGKEMELLKKFNGLTMKMFENGKEVFSGGYKKQSDFEYVPIYPKKIKTVRVSEEPIEEEDWIGKCDCTCRCFNYYYMVLLWTLGAISGTFYIIYRVSLYLIKKENAFVRSFYIVFVYSFIIFVILSIIMSLKCLCEL